MATAKKTPAAKTPGTAVAVKSSKTGVISIQDEIRRKAEAMSERMDPASGTTIRVTQSKTMKLPNGQEVEEIDLVIVDFTATQNYYPGKFDSKNPTPPDCFAIGDNPRKLVPSLTSPNLQIAEKDAVEGKGCNVCPQFQWGSDGAGKACKSGRKLAVLPPGAGPDDPLWILNVSPTALKGWDTYLSSLQRMGTIPVAMVVHVDFNTAAEHSQLRFSDPQPNEHIEAHYARTEEARQLLMQEPDVSQWKPVAGPKSRTTRK